MGSSKRRIAAGKAEWRLFAFVVALAAIVVAAIAIQLCQGAHADPLWLMLLCDRLLDGQTAYIDFLENSPPFAIIIYMPPVAAERLFGVAREPALVAYVAIMSAASLGACAWLLNNVGRLAGVGMAGALAATACLLLLIDFQFGQRDHFALILALPWLTLMGLRAEGERPPTFSAILAGSAAGVIFAIRPHYVVSFALVVAWIGWRRGFWALFSYEENLAAAASAVVCVTASAVFFPYYFTKMLPIALNVYGPYRLSWPLLVLNPAIVACTLIAAALFAWRTRLREAPLAIILVLAALGVVISYFQQGKGFTYHAYPAVACLTIAFTIVVGSRLATLEAIVFVGLGIALSAIIVADGRNVSLDLLLKIEVFAGIYLLLALLFTAIRFGAKPIAMAGVGVVAVALGLAWSIFHDEWSGPLAFADEVRQLGPHPKVGVIAPSGAEIRLTSRAHAGWIQSVTGLILTDAATHLIADGVGDAERRERLEQYIAQDRDRFLADVGKSPPDAVIVDETWARTRFSDPAVTEWLRGYRLSASRGVPLSNSVRLYRLYTRSTLSNPSI